MTMTMKLFRYEIKVQLDPRYEDNWTRMVKPSPHPAIVLVFPQDTHHYLAVNGRAGTDRNAKESEHLASL